MTASVVRGGCQCGKVRYEVRNFTGRVYACHCLECQKQSSSAFGLTLPSREADVSFRGRLAVYQRPADSGSTTRCFFCPDCGTRLYHHDATAGEFLSLKAGSLDDTSALELVANIWVCRKQPWVVMDRELPWFETQPEDLASWRAGLVGAA